MKTDTAQRSAGTRGNAVAKKMQRCPTEQSHRDIIGRKPWLRLLRQVSEPCALAARDRKRMASTIRYPAAHRWNAKRHCWKARVACEAGQFCAFSRFMPDSPCNSLSVRVLRFGKALAHRNGKSVRRSAGWTSRAGTRGTAALFVRIRKTNGTVSAGPTHCETQRPLTILTRKISPQSNVTGIFYNFGRAQGLGQPPAGRKHKQRKAIAVRLIKG